MSPPQSIGQIRYLVQSEQLEEAQAELLNLLSYAPRNGEAWTIAAQLTSDLEQRKEFLRRVFEYSANPELADWAFHNLGEYLSKGSIEKLSPPPIESLIIRSDTKISLDHLLVLPEKGEPTPSASSNVPPPTDVSKNDAPAPPSGMQDWQIKVKETTPLFSVKRLGEWIILVGGLIFIASVYFEPLSNFFRCYRISSLFYCFLPMFVLGLITVLIGFFVDKK